MPAEEWHPYSPYSFITPPFPGYVSEHSTVSAASARVLELFTGSNYFGATEIRHAGELTEPGVSCEVKQSVNGKAPSTGITPDGVITLQLHTFSATAEMAGLSLVMGSYHIQADNIASLELGAKSPIIFSRKHKLILTELLYHRILNQIHEQSGLCGVD